MKEKCFNSKQKTKHVNLQNTNTCIYYKQKWQGMSATKTEMFAFQLKK